MSDDRAGSAVADSISAIGIEPTSITRRSDAKEPVYEIHSGSGRYFAKRLTDEKGSAMRDVLDRDLAVEMPDSRLVRDDSYLLVMEPATGKPLSLSLPVCMFPGLWWALSGSLSRAVHEIGIGLGELHSGTYTGDRRPDDGCRMADRLVLDQALRDHLSDETVTEIRRLFDELCETHLPCTKIHGDPTPHNIFWDVGTGDVDIIDFNLHRSVAVEDIVVFEAGIELMAARLPYARRSQKTALIEAFRSGYTKNGVHDPVPTRTVAITKVSYYAHLLGKFLRGVSFDTRRDKITRYTDKRIAERKIESLVSQL